MHKTALEDAEYLEAKKLGEQSRNSPVQPSLEYTYIEPSPKIEDPKRQEELRRYKDTSKMRNRLGYWILGAVIAQVTVLDVGMLFYLGFNIKNPNQAIMIAWLTTNFTEIVGILIVVARSIFPPTMRSEQE